MGEFALRLSDAYREAHNLLTSSQIKDRRVDLGMSQQQFAQYLGVGVASIKRWELGQIQDEAMNSLIILKTDLAVAEQNVAEIASRMGKPVWKPGDLLDENTFYATYFEGHGLLWEPHDSPFKMGVACHTYASHTESIQSSKEEQITELERVGRMQFELVA
jgi:transcriptional regulator with XRE-family HTH domain